MKITAGLGSIDEYISYVQAGVDELFCGYVPYWWMRKVGNLHSLNRREVMYYNVQIGSESELKILKRMIDKYGVPVSIALNSPFYRPEHYPMILDVMRECIRNGFEAFIIADHVLLLYVERHMRMSVHIHVSGELGEINRYLLDELSEMKNICRIIFHRKTLISDMKTMIHRQTEGVQKREKKQDVYEEQNAKNPLEYEAFVLNEMCHYTGAFCNSLHCDEFEPACRLPYRIGKITQAPDALENLPEQPGDLHGTSENPKVCNEKSLEYTSKIIEDNNSEQSRIAIEEECFEDIPGQSGCGLCALWKLQKAGITYAKLVSRGNFTDQTKRDITVLKKAIQILESSSHETQFIQRMKQEIFHGSCSGNCYYRSEEN